MIGSDGIKSYMGHKDRQIGSKNVGCSIAQSHLVGAVLRCMPILLKKQWKNGTEEKLR